MSFTLGFFEAQMKREDKSRWQAREIAKRNPAMNQGLTECIKCGFCCARKTCVPTPDELEPIAEYLGISIDEMIKKYMIGDSQQGCFFLRFANSSQKDLLGSFVPWQRTYDSGDCLLFEREKGCLIYSVRPKDARENQCWTDNNGNIWNAVRKWGIGDLRTICPDMDIVDDEDW